MSADTTHEDLKEISTKLDALLALMRIAFRESIEAAKEKSFARSEFKQTIYDLCDGRNTVNDMAEELGKSAAFVRVYLGTLADEGLIVRKGDTWEAVV
jgi:hypothetical protein